MGKVKLLKPKYDVVFHALFGENNIFLAEKFISDILGYKIKIESVLDRHMNIKVAEQKLGVLDYRARLEDKTICNIEIQLNEHDYEIERFVYYLSDTYSRQLTSGGEYTDLNKTISIIILDHEIKLLEKFNELDVKWHMRDNKGGKTILTPNFEMCIIELPKAIRLYEKLGNNKLCQWMLFLDDPNSREVLRIMKENKDIKEAVKKLECVSCDEEVRRIAELKEKARRDENAVKDFVMRKGIEEGRQKGIYENKKLMVKNMLKEELDVELISKITGLTKSEILEMK